MLQPRRTALWSYAGYASLEVPPFTGKATCTIDETQRKARGKSAATTLVVGFLAVVN